MSLSAGMRTNPPVLVLHALIICTAILVCGCEIRPKPILHRVEYQSSLACASSPEECPWSRLEQQARFSAKVNCLLSGATVISSKQAGLSTGAEGDILVSIPPRYGYDRFTETGDGRRCAPTQTVCGVASRYDRELTWASCGSQPPKEGEFRGGQDLYHADRLTDRVIVTGNLAQARNAFKPPQGLDGPDHFYTFTLTHAMRLEAAVGANTSFFPLQQGHRSPWQPGLYLLDSNGETLARGRVWRGGVTCLFPAQMGPGMYYLVVDASQKEYARGDGLYHLYLGLNNNYLGPIDPSPSKLQ